MRTLVALMIVPALLAACGDGEVTVDSTATEEVEGGPLKVVQTLQCPQTQGSLTRKGTASADGMTCTYLGPRGSDVVLTLVRLDGKEPTDILLGVERRLGALMPEALAKLAEARAEKEAEAQAEAPDTETSSGDRANISMPGIDIQADGDRANLRIGPIRIDAENDAADINIAGGDGAVSIQANGDAAEVRTQHTGAGVRATYVLAYDNPSAEGLRMVGYQARGPKTGPLVIATVRSKDRESDGLMDDAADLVELNVGE